MKNLLLLFSAFSCLVNYGQKAECTCAATTEFSHQDRSSAKHETNYGNFAKKKDTITVDYIYKWEAKYSKLTATISKKADNPKSVRKKGTPEDTLYILKGFMWFVKAEGNDCDFHIEVGPDKASSTRIVVEVPKENTELHKKIKTHLDALELKIMGCGTSDSQKAHFENGIPVVIKGLGFYDKSHKPNTNHGDAHTKKYSWELHPVETIIFL